MTLEYRCSNCGTLLQTTNADPLDNQIGALVKALTELLDVCESMGDFKDPICANEMIDQARNALLLAGDVGTGPK